MRIVNQITKALAGLFRSTSANANSKPQSASPPATQAKSEVEFCGHPRHGAFPVRRKCQASGVSAHGHKFVVFQCPSCGEFVARTLDPVTGREHILFRGKFYRPNYNPRRDARHTPAFRPLRPAYTAS